MTPPQVPSAARPEPIYYRTDPPYAGSAPCFYDLESLPWARALRDGWRIIRDEYEENRRRGTDQVVDVFNPTGPKVPGWSSVNFETYLWRRPSARAAFPRTTALLDAIPGLTSAFINVLAPHSEIPPHHGDSNVIVRCHLGLDVPDGDCAIRVGPETRQCANGVLLAFCDAHDHAAWNRTAAHRTVLVFDVLLPAYQREARSICANVLAATAVVWLEARLPVWRRFQSAALLESGKTVPLPQPVRTALRRALGFGIWLWLPIQRRRGGTSAAARDSAARVDQDAAPALLARASGAE